MLIGTLLGLEAIVTAVLNLDTAAVFMTPIILHAARQRGCDRRPFLYGALFVANGASLLLPGSNLTNLIVLAHESLTGADFAREMALPWLAVVVVTVGFLTLMFGLGPGRGAQPPAPPVRLGTGVAAAAAATALMLVLHNPALPVLGVGRSSGRRRRCGGRCSVERDRQQFPGGDPALCAEAAASAAAADRLNLGPNLLFTGSLSAYLWYRAALRVGVQPSLRQSFLLGLVLVPLTMAAALGVLALTSPGAF